MVGTIRLPAFGPAIVLRREKRPCWPSDAKVTRAALVHSKRRQPHDFFRSTRNLECMRLGTVPKAESLAMLKAR